MSSTKPETPQKIRDNITDTIRGLNARWDLEIPETYEPSVTGLPKTIYNSIRFLCCRPNYNLQRCLEDFEDEARQVNSDWIFKPSQERGTLPSLQKSRSQLYKDSIRNPRKLTDQERRGLLQRLDKLLSDERHLADDSEHYIREPGDARESGAGTSTYGHPAVSRRFFQFAPSRNSVDSDPFLPTRKSPPSRSNQIFPESPERQSATKKRCGSPPLVSGRPMDRARMAF